MTKDDANCRQVGGEHYKQITGNCPRCGAEIEHWDLFAMLPYLPAQIAKYVLRFEYKNGIEDLEKARHFLQKLMEVATVQACHQQAVQDALIDDPKEDTIYTDLAAAAIARQVPQAPPAAPVQPQHKHDPMLAPPTYTVLGRALLKDNKQVGWITFDKE